MTPFGSWLVVSGAVTVSGLLALLEEDSHQLKVRSGDHEEQEYTCILHMAPQLWVERKDG